MKKLLGVLTTVAITVGSLGLGTEVASAATGYYYHHHHHYVFACRLGYHPVRVYRHGRWVWRCYSNHHHRHHYYIHRMY